MRWTISVGQRDRDSIEFTGEGKRAALVRAIVLCSAVETNIKRVCQRVRVDVHTRHFGLVDFGTIHEQFAVSTEGFGQLEVELQFDVSLR